MANSKIRTFADPILRQPSSEVTEIDDNIRQLFQEMLSTLHHTQNGIGLSACQIGILKRLVVLDYKGTELKLVNPKLVRASGEITAPENCLSFPGISGLVSRPANILVQAQDEYGKLFQIQAANLYARCLCHELDHLDGIVFTSKIIKPIRPSFRHA